MLKNTAGQSFRVYAFYLATGEDALGDAANITCKVSIDDGTRATLATPNPVEQEDGFYLYRPAQGETNGDTLDWYPESSTPGVKVVVVYEPRRTTAATTTSVTPSVPSGSVPFGLDEPVLADCGSDVTTTITLGLSESTATLSDAVARLSDRAGSFEYDSSASSDPREQRRCVRASRDALRDLASVYDWRYYQSGFRVTTSESVDVDAATYVAATGILTITSSEVWPDDAIYGEVTIDGVRYAIATRTSDSVVVLVPSSKRQSDFTGSAQWTRARYTTPLIRSIYGVWEEGPERPLTYLSPAEFHMREAILPTGGTPVAYTLEHGNRDHYLALSAAPTNSRSYTIAAKLAPPYPKLFREFTAVTGTGGEYTAYSSDANENWIGTVVRIAPSGTSGDDAKDQAILYDDWGWQALITAVSGTALTLSEALLRTLTAERAIVSSPIDVSATMQTYFESLAYARYCRNHKHDSLGESMALADQDLMRAMEADAVVNQSDRFTSRSDNQPLYDIHMETWS